MKRIIKTELLKLKRYHILWTGVALMLLSVILTLFTTLAEDGTVWTYAFLSEQVVKNNMTMIFPMCITLIAGYIVNREIKDDTLKNIYVVPISFCQLLTGKLIIVGLLSIVLGAVCAVFTILGCFIAKISGFSIILAAQSFFQQMTVNLFLYIAVLPIIIATSRSQNGFLAGVIVAFVYGYGGMFAAGNDILVQIYPITASLGMAGYRNYEVNWNMPLCCASMAVTIFVSIIMILSMRKNMDKPKCKKIKSNSSLKKGW